MINLSVPQPEAQLRPRITVFGVGGAGGNAVNNMIRSALEGVDFVATNTDAQSLAGSLADRKLQLGVGITQGLGAGSRPDVGRGAAEEAIEEIAAYLEGVHMVFITAGMGGGTGTGAAPVIARAAREQGVLTVGVVTKPFHFEGAHRMKIAENGIDELQQFVDTLIIIPNQNLFRIANEKTTFADAFKMADDVLHAGVRGVTDLMVMPGLINLDFADIRTVMAEMGKAMMGTGEATGERRSVLAAEAAISNPLLDEVSMRGARGVLINITGGGDMTLYEVDEAANRIRDEVDPEANIIFGSTFDESLDGQLRVSVVATGIDIEVEQTITTPGTMRNLIANRSIPGVNRPMPAEGGLRLGVPAGIVAPARNEPAAPEPVAEPTQSSEEPAVQPAAESDVPAVPPTPQPAAAAPPARPEPHQPGTITPWPAPAANRAQPAPRHAAGPATVADGEDSAADHVKRRGGSIFRRMTGLLHTEEAPHDETVRAAAPGPAVHGPQTAPMARPAAAYPRPDPRVQRQEIPDTRTGPVQTPAPAPTQAPASAPAQAQARLDIPQRPPLPRNDDDALDIPAFLRRQAN